jgi:hypothetical protein
MQLDDEDVLDALTIPCPNVRTGYPSDIRIVNPHSGWESCAECIQGRKLTDGGIELADLLAKYLKKEG